MSRRLADIRFVLARALVPEEPERARALAAQAVEGGSSEQQQEVEAWLEAHPD